MVKLEINNKTKSKFSKKQVENILTMVCPKSKSEQLVSVALVSAQTIRQLNKKYRKKDQVTDVLAFAQPKDFDQVEEPIGEVIICSVRAKKQANEHHHSFQKEINKLALHGYLHLIGYDHKRAKQAEQMEKLEKIILKRFYDKN